MEGASCSDSNLSPPKLLLSTNNVDHSVSSNSLGVTIDLLQPECH